jgi:hypothetical protein
MKFSKPTKNLTINGWLHGTKCVFSVESKNRLERAVRTTDNPKGGTSKSKKLTYGQKVVFVIGDDNKIYILILSRSGLINVMQSNMKHSEAYFYEQDPEYKTLLTLIESCDQN